MRLCVKGIDVLGVAKPRNTARKAPASENIYLRLLVKLYKFLARRVDPQQGGKFNSIVLKRLMQSRTNRPALGLRRLVKYMKGKEDKIAVLVSTVTDDARVLSVPKMTVCALRFTDAARARIEKAGGQCLTFDKLALLRPTGANTGMEVCCELVPIIRSSAAWSQECPRVS